MIQVGGDGYDFPRDVDVEAVAAKLLQTPRDFAAAYRREFGFVLRGREVIYSYIYCACLNIHIHTHTHTHTHYYYKRRFSSNIHLISTILTFLYLL